MELVNNVDEIIHPSVKACLKETGLDCLEIHHDGDLPGRSGLGSSSSFTVALLLALHTLKGQIVSKGELAREAIRIEQEVLGESVGCQDQIAAAIGGFSRMAFFDGGWTVEPVSLQDGFRSELEQYMTMFFVGESRLSSEVAKVQVETIDQQAERLNRMADMVDDGITAIASHDLRRFGELLHVGWLIKRSLTPIISNSVADGAYDAAMKAGAWGGKLLGAGAGGFMLIFRPPDVAAKVSQALDKLLEVPIKFERGGAQIIYY